MQLFNLRQHGPVVYCETGRGLLLEFVAENNKLFLRERGRRSPRYFNLADFPVPPPAAINDTYPNRVDLIIPAPQFIPTSFGFVPPSAEGRTACLSTHENDLNHYELDFDAADVCVMLYDTDIVVARMDPYDPHLDGFYEHTAHKLRRDWLLAVREFRATNDMALRAAINATVSYHHRLRARGLALALRRSSDKTPYFVLVDQRDNTTYEDPSNPGKPLLFDFLGQAKRYAAPRPHLAVVRLTGPMPL